MSRRGRKVVDEVGSTPTREQIEGAAQALAGHDVRMLSVALPVESVQQGAFEYPTLPGQRVDPMMFKAPYPTADGGQTPIIPPRPAGSFVMPLPLSMDPPAHPFKGPSTEPAPILCIGLGLLKDGRHVAFEAELRGPEVKEWRPLCARPQVDGPERAWWQVGFARLCAKRELLPAEVEANTRDSHGVRPEHFSEGAAVAILGTGRTCTALALRLEGTTVAEPKVVARGAREFCWSELAVWASLNMLPRRRKP